MSLRQTLPLEHQFPMAFDELHPFLKKVLRGKGCTCQAFEKHDPWLCRWFHLAKSNDIGVLPFKNERAQTVCCYLSARAQFDPCKAQRSSPLGGGVFRGGWEGNFCRSLIFFMLHRAPQFWHSTCQTPLSSYC